MAGSGPARPHRKDEYDDFYEIEVDDVRLIDWLEDLAAGEPVDDVHCDQCA
ncbi:hypothetical protein [Glycomyces buryatensis]|uniref:hypothetical protein n=1 Tax=Glycomyces buryatensis TaxID=2570927 RepID=UPI00145629F2|nr:hypothetical protein [Glycomyces buryatensis]